MDNNNINNSNDKYNGNYSYDRNYNNANNNNSGYKKRTMIQSKFEELNRMPLSCDKSIIISLKEHALTKEMKISIAQGVKIIPEGLSKEVEIFYPHALTLSLKQAEELVSILNTEVTYLKKTGRMNKNM